MKLSPTSTRPRCVILNLTGVHRIETSVAQFFDRKACEYLSKEPPMSLIIAGVRKGSGVHADLERGGVCCRWEILDMEGDADKKPVVITFEDLREALHWSTYPCRSISDYPVLSDDDADPCLNTGPYGASNLEVLDAFCRLVSEDSWSTLIAPFPISEIELAGQMQSAGIEIHRPVVGEVLAEGGNHLLCGAFQIAD